MTYNIERNYPATWQALTSYCMAHTDMHLTSMPFINAALEQPMADRLLVEQFLTNMYHSPVLWQTPAEGLPKLLKNPNGAQRLCVPIVACLENMGEVTQRWLRNHQSYLAVQYPFTESMHYVVLDAPDGAGPEAEEWWPTYKRLVARTLYDLMYIHQQASLDTGIGQGSIGVEFWDKYLTDMGKDVADAMQMSLLVQTIESNLV